METKTINVDQIVEVSHIIADENHSALVNSVKLFEQNRIKDGAKNFRVHYTTTAILAPVQQQNNFGGQPQMALKFMIAALCIWEDTLTASQAFYNKMQLSGGKLF